jgi:hypothetical protein
MGRHDLSNKHIVVNNMKSAEEREETVWQKMANMWNDEKFAPMTMALSPKLSMQFVNSWVITFDSCSEYAAATPDKCANQLAMMIVELHRLIGWWLLSGKGDEDLGKHDADDKNNNFGNLSRCSQGALDSQANFLGTSQLYILYLREYLNVHDLLKTSFQCLDPKVVAKNETDQSKRNGVCFWWEGVDGQKISSIFFRSIFNPTHHSLPFLLDFLAGGLALAGKCCWGKLGWSDLSIPCQKLHVSTKIPSQKLLCVQTEIKKSQKNYSDHRDINKKL